MRRILNFRNLLCAALLCGALGATGTASACDYYWKTVTVYVSVEQPVVRYVTKYDHCGQPYQAKVVSTRTVEVPVTRKVKVYL